jgi:hypothetical protein
MGSKKLYLASAAFLVFGLASLWFKWNGSAGINAGDSIAAWSVNFSGSVNGWPAMIGILAIVAAILVFLAAVISTVLSDSKG